MIKMKTVKGQLKQMPIGTFMALSVQIKFENKESWKICEYLKLLLKMLTVNKQKIIMVLLFVYIPQFAEAVVYVQKDIQVQVGETFKIAPWSDSSSKLSGYKCFSTGISRITDRSAFDLGTPSSTTVSYVPEYNGGTTTGTIRVWKKVKALKSGTYTIIGVAEGRKRSGNNFYIGTCYITYNVTVSEKPVVKSIDIPSSIVLKIGESYTFSPVVYESGAITTFTWTSSNNKIATISSDGVLKALSEGSTTITCVAANGISAKCVVTVKPIYVTSIALNYDEYRLEKGGILQLEATIKPANSTTKDISWKTSNENVAIVNSKGCIIGVNDGYCTITAMTTDGSNKSASCIVFVYTPTIFIESIRLDKSFAMMDVGATLILTADILPLNATNIELSWTSSNSSVATVENGNVMSVGCGETTIVAMANDGSGKLASCDICVVNDVTGIETQVPDTDNTIVGVYDTMGRNIQVLRSGLNIIRYSNGKIRKVIVK